MEGKQTLLLSSASNDTNVSNIPPTSHNSAWSALECSCQVWKNGSSFCLSVELLIFMRQQHGLTCYRKHSFINNIKW